MPTNQFGDPWQDHRVPLAPIHTDRLLLRPLAANDSAAVFAILGHQPTVANVSFGHATIDYTKNYVSRRARDEADLGYSMWAVQLVGSDTLVGLWGLRHRSSISDRTRICHPRWPVGQGLRHRGRWRCSQRSSLRWARRRRNDPAHQRTVPCRRCSNRSRPHRNRRSRTP